MYYCWIYDLGAGQATGLPIKTGCGQRSQPAVWSAPSRCPGWANVVEKIKPEALLENLDPVSDTWAKFKGYKLFQDIDKW